jgi:hypothetical protein
MSVYCAVRAEYLNIIHNNINLQINLPIKYRAMAQAVSRATRISEVRIRSQFSPCEICGGQSGTGTGFFE